MRFRRLTSEELSALEKEFIEFLAISGVEAHDWEDFKTTNPNFCEEKIEEFSDVVIGTILRNARYAEHRSPSDWMLFKLEDELIHLILIHSTELDLTRDTLNEDNLSKIQITRTSKSYAPNKEDELFKMMQQGCIITDGKVYESIVQLN